jgi:hypothetical protein
VNDLSNEELSFALRLYCAQEFRLGLTVALVRAPQKADTGYTQTSNDRS